MSLRVIVRLFRQKLWIFVLAGILAGVLSYRVLLGSGSIPRYSAEAVIAVGGDAYRDVQDVGYMEIAETLIANYLEVAELELITGPVAHRISGQLTAAQIAEAINVTRLEGTNLISIQATSADPALAATLANGVAAELARLAPPRWPQFVLPVKTAEPANTPDQTAWLPVILSVFVGVLLAVGVVLLNEFMRDPIYSESEAAALFQAPVLASLQPRPFWRARLAVGGEWLKSADTTWWSLREASRRRLAGDPRRPKSSLAHDLWPAEHVAPLWLRRNQAPASAAESNHKEEAAVILVTSVMGDGTAARVATQLARAWAAAGENVLLADLNVAHPEAGRFTLSTQPTAGFATLLGSPETKIAGLISRDSRPGSRLMILPAGCAERAAEPYQQAAALDSLIEQTAATHTLILSAPPLADSVAALHAAARANLTLVALDVGITRRSDAADVVDRLRALNARLGGLVAVHFPPDQAGAIESSRQWIVYKLHQLRTHEQAVDDDMEQGEIARGQAGG
jgi:capsular polysaccharide biosynthesis protein/Mrp family chromosome partitioning ATPase